VYTLDLPESQLGDLTMSLSPGEDTFVRKTNSGSRYRDTEEETRITQLLGDSAHFDYASWRGRMDFVFVDGSHALDYVLSDSMNALTLLKPEGGIIVWHDYGEWPGVTLALKHLYQNNERFAAMNRIKNTTLVILQIQADERSR
jgi:hypothetical protein